MIAGRTATPCDCVSCPALSGDRVRWVGYPRPLAGLRSCPGRLANNPPHTGGERWASKDKERPHEHPISLAPQDGGPVSTDAPQGTSELAGRRVLVTGGSGFIGRHVVSELNAAGARVRVVDLQPHPDPQVDIVIGDIAEPAVLERAFDGGFESIVHLAAVTSVLRSLEHPAAHLPDQRGRHPGRCSRPGGRLASRRWPSPPPTPSPDRWRRPRSSSRRGCAR